MSTEDRPDNVTTLFEKGSPSWEKRVNEFLKPLEDEGVWAHYQSWAVYTLPSDGGGRTVHVLYGQGSRVAAALRKKIQEENAHPHKDARGMFQKGTHIDGFPGGPSSPKVQNEVCKYVRAETEIQGPLKAHFAQ